MEKIMQELDSAFKIISTIPVSHDNVEKMAKAKGILRQVYAELAGMSRAEDIEQKDEHAHD